MRPIKLTLSAFGPFASLEQIDFTVLGENPLFLINGPTGSGKTTILDGICYALYGKTTGDEREAGQMRCDAAEADCLTFVELSFRLGKDHWRIRREPEQLRPKGRGEGLTTHQPRAEIYRKNDAGDESVVVASRVTDARSVVEDLIGLNVDQFRQVMVLPQGEFRRVLLAGSGDRERVFSHLFQTRIYSRIENALKEQAATVRKQVEASRNQYAGILRSVDLESEEQLQHEMEIMVEQHGAVSECRDDAGAKRQQAHTVLLNAQKLAADFRRLEGIRTSLDVLHSREREMAKRRQQLQRAQWVLGMKPEFEHWQHAQNTCKELEKEQARAVLEVETARGQLLSAEQRLQDVLTNQHAFDSRRRELVQLESYRERVTQFEIAAQTRRQSKQALQKCERTQQTAQDRCREAEEMLQAAEQTHLALIDQLRGMGDLRLEHGQLSSAYQNALSLEQLAKEVQGCEKKIADKRVERDALAAKLQVCEQEELRLELEWHRGQAVVLAKKLEPDLPCPVCGSLSHPAPAHSEIEIPDEEARQAVASRTVGLREQLAEQESAIVRQQSDLHAMRDKDKDVRAELGTGEEPNLLDLARQLDTLQQRIDLLEKEKLREAEYAETVTRGRARLQGREQQLSEANKRHSDILTSSEVARNQLLLAEKELPERYRDSEELESAIQLIQSEQEQFQRGLDLAQQGVSESQLELGKAHTRLENWNQQLKAALETEQTAEKAWLNRLQASQLDDMADFLQARLDQSAMLALEREIELYRVELEQARGAVVSLEEALKGERVPDMAALESNFERATENLKAVDAEFKKIDRRYSRLQDIVSKLESLQNEREALEHHYALVGTLADTANGRTGDRISLQRFVLSVLLDDVLLMASQRFRKMSKGRYALYRQQERGKGAGASGLELMVDDAYSGKQRPVATLSGGESFMAALSLALGLSDVVQSYAGGIRLDALFVDEGFGSLDPESLDLAINTLMDLHQSGRMVGVISHVPELRERIKSRLDVIADHGGSRTRVVLE